MRSPVHYLWAVLIAHIHEVFSLLCPLCGGQMRLIAFITEGRQIRKILDHIGVDSEPPQISPARGPPLWDDGDAQTDDGCALSPIGQPTGIGGATGPRLRGRSAHKLVNWLDLGFCQNGDSASLPGSGAPGIPGAPPIPLVNNAFWRWIGQKKCPF